MSHLPSHHTHMPTSASRPASSIVTPHSPPSTTQTPYLSAISPWRYTAAPTPDCATSNHVNQDHHQSMSPSAPLRPTLGEYVMSFYMGTPPIKRWAIVDSGSSLLWVQCEPCVECYEPLKGGKHEADETIHGSDGLGNIFLPTPKGNKIGKSASKFLIDKVLECPGVVSILALGPLTNLALAIKKDSSFASKVKRIVILGGAFLTSGNMNPAAEANIYADPDAADVVFTSGANIDIVGINITTQVVLTDADLAELKASNGRYAQIISDMGQFYRDWHVKSEGIYGIVQHDPVCFVALVRPDLFTFKKGVVRVETQGICLGLTLLDQGLKRWNRSNPWTGYSSVSVAWTVDVEGVIAFIKNLVMKP